ncbi:hypothetical protein KR067_003073, partial [Drosophila pandora]
NTEYYSSSCMGLVKLLKLENEFMRNFTLYTDDLQEKVNTLSLYLESLKRTKHSTQKEREKFVSNPINSFGLIRRLHQDWIKLQKYVYSPVGMEMLDQMEAIVKKAPEAYDMNEAQISISRIETTYELKVNDLANGIIYNEDYRSEMGVRDFFALAQHRFKTGDNNRSLEWLEEARQYKSLENQNNTNKILGDPWEEFARSTIMHNISLANPSLNNETIYKQASNKLKVSEPKEIDKVVYSLLTQWKQESHNVTNSTEPSLIAHYTGCRNQFPKQNNLVCRYNATTTPFLKLAPLKLEEVSLDPYIVLYHNVISDREIEEMKGLIDEMDNGWTDLNESREIVSRLVWLTKESRFRKRLNLRIRDITGFNVDEIRGLQIANFGVGGQFKPHYDYITERILRLNNTILGDRMASIIFYVGDVVHGGQTVFPDIQIAVKPQKGSSLFWFNTFDDATPDPRSLHSVCPVLIGDRWSKYNTLILQIFQSNKYISALTKWLHYEPQLFVKPCYPKIRE